MKKFTAILISSLMVISLVACGNSSSSSGSSSGSSSSSSEESAAAAEDAAEAEAAPAAEAEAAPAGSGETYTIGLAAMLTGSNALNGEHMQAATELAIKKYNTEAGYEKFVVDIMDDLTTDEGALTAVQKLIADGCLAIVGPHRSSAAVACSDTAEENGVAFLTGGTSVAIDGSKAYRFRTRTSDSTMASAASKYVAEVVGAKKIGILHSADEFGMGGGDQVKAFCDNNGLEYVDEPHNVNDVDFTTSILNLQAQGVDAVVIWTHDAEMAIIAQQLATYLPDVPVVSSPGVTLDNVLGLVDDEWVDGWYAVTDFIHSQEGEVSEEFVANYNADYGENPDLYAAAYYGAACTIMEAINNAEAEGEVTTATVRDKIAETEGLELPTGTFYCDDVNDLSHTCIMVKMNGKEAEYIETVTAD